MVPEPQELVLVRLVISFNARRAYTFHKARLRRFGHVSLAVYFYRHLELVLKLSIVQLDVQTYVGCVGVRKLSQLYSVPYPLGCRIDQIRGTTTQDG